MSHSQQFLPKHGQATEMLAQLALCLLKGEQLPSLPGVAATAPAVPATAGSAPVELTVRADQVKVIGAGRRPASLVGRQVMVTLVATVVAEHENGTLTVTVAEADRTARRPRAKRPAKVSRRSMSKGRGRSAKKRPAGRRAVDRAQEGTD
ncbi:hypothetical protein [Gemmatimonas sp.]|jgi:hypothetical protein|uniref:hypothetical protein n=1 Tax=Gemmatimonas sp. TaxID=1962908 RepID=UPI0037BED021